MKEWGHIILVFIHLSECEGVEPVFEEGSGGRGYHYLQQPVNSPKFTDGSGGRRPLLRITLLWGFKRWGFEWFSRGGFRSGRMRKTRFYDWTMAMMMSNWTFIMISDRILLPILWFLRRLSSRESGFELCGILYWFAFRWSIFDFWALIRHLERGEHFIHESSLTMAATIESDKYAEYLQFLEQFSDSLFSTLLN